METFFELKGGLLIRILLFAKTTKKYNYTYSLFLNEIGYCILQKTLYLSGPFAYSRRFVRKIHPIVSLYIVYTLKGSAAYSYDWHSNLLIWNIELYIIIVNAI